MQRCLKLSSRRAPPQGVRRARVMNVKVVLDETQVEELAGEKWKQHDVTKDMLSLCADDAANTAARAIMALMATNADMRGKRLAERFASDSDVKDKRVVERMDDVRVPRMGERQTWAPLPFCPLSHFGCTKLFPFDTFFFFGSTALIFYCRQHC